MPPIRPLTSISEKYKRVTPDRVTEYLKGVANPLTPWRTSAGSDEAETNYDSAMSEVIQQKRRQQGVLGVTEADWKDSATQKGKDRYPTGVRLGAPKYEAKFAPFRQTIADTQLPPKGRKGDPKNIERVRVMNEALRQRKLALLQEKGAK